MKLHINNLTTALKDKTLFFHTRRGISLFINLTTALEMTDEMFTNLSLKEFTKISFWVEDAQEDVFIYADKLGEKFTSKLRAIASKVDEKLDLVNPTTLGLGDWLEYGKN